MAPSSRKPSRGSHLDWSTLSCHCLLWSVSSCSLSSLGTSVQLTVRPVNGSHCSTRGTLVLSQRLAHSECSRKTGLWKEAKTTLGKAVPTWKCEETGAALPPNPTLFIFSTRDMGGADGEMTHDSQITQEAVPKGTSEPSYTSVNRGPPLDRAEVYASKLQD